MKGATAEPLVSTISPPKSAMTMKTGSNQYFLRVRRNAQNSARKPVIRPSELVVESLRCRTGWLAGDPVGFGRRLKLPPKRVPTGYSHQHANRCHAHVEQDSKDHGADYHMEQETDFRPQTIEWREKTRRGVREHGKHAGEREPIVPALGPAVEAQGTKQCEKTGEDEAEAALG